MRNYLLPRTAQAVDAELDEVAGLQINRSRFHAERDSRRRARADDVAGQQSHELADIADERRDAEDHVRRRALLPDGAVHREPHAECVRIGDLVAGREKGTDRRERVRALALDPLPAAFELKTALRVVVVQRIAGHMIQRALFCNIRSAAANDHGELDLPIQLAPALWNR